MISPRREPTKSPLCDQPPPAALIHLLLLQLNKFHIKRSIRGMLGCFHETRQRAATDRKSAVKPGSAHVLACGQESQIHSMSQGLNIISIPGSCRGSLKTMDN